MQVCIGVKTFLIQIDILNLKFVLAHYGVGSNEILMNIRETIIDNFRFWKIIRQRFVP